MLTSFMIAVVLSALTPVTHNGEVAVPQQAPETERIAIPFNPPLGQPITYRHRKSTTRGNTRMSVWMDYRYTFSRDGEGFLMRVEPIEMGVEAPVLRTPAAREAVRRMWQRTMLPFTARLSADAILEEVVDEDAIWEQVVERTMAIVAQNEQNPDAQALAFAGQAMRDMPTDSRRILLMQQTGPVLELAATNYSARASEAIAYTFEAPFGGTIEQRATVTVTNIGEDTVSYSFAASVPGEQMLATITNLIERAPLNGRGQNTPAGRVQALREMREAEMRMEADSRYEVDRSSGLSRRYAIETRVIVRGGTSTVEQREVLSGEHTN